MAEQEESSTEYLSYDYEFPFTCWDMISGKFVIPIPELLEHLEAAKKLLIETEGPHQKDRIEDEREFIGWWITFFKEYSQSLDEQLAGSKLLSLDEVEESNRRAAEDGKITGCTFANGCEGARHHRHMISYITSVVRDDKGYMGLLIDEHIASDKKRRKRFLPLQMILSMWAYYFTFDLDHNPTRTTSLDYLSVIPDKPKDENVNDYYNRIFLKTGAMFYFVEENDPHLKEKIVRNFFRSGWPKDDNPWFVFNEDESHIFVNTNAIIFSHLDSKRTSDIVLRLMGQRHDEDQ